MKYRTIALLILIFNIAVVGLLLLDSFLPPGKGRPALVDDKRIERSAGKVGSRGHSTFFILDERGTKYKVPDDEFERYSPGDSFYVFRSVFFGKAIRIKPVKPEHNEVLNIGVINSSVFGLLICLATIAISVVLLYKVIIKNITSYRASLFTIWLTIIIIAFYMIFQS